MAEPQEPETDWTASQVKRSLDEKITAMERAIDVAREGVPPHVTIQDFFERLGGQRDRYEDKLAVEREKGIQVALVAADKLEQERLARNHDQIVCERRITELTRQLSDTAILKAEAAAEKQFDEFTKTVEKQLDGLRTDLQGLTQRIDRLI